MNGHRTSSVRWLAITMRSFAFVSLLLTLPPVLALNPTIRICSHFSNVPLQHSKIRFSTPILAGSNFTGDSTETSYNTVQTALPTACRIACEVETSGNSTARFEIWLPTKSAWNSRFLAVGNGGWAGGINYPDIVMGLKQGECDLCGIPEVPPVL